MWIEELPNGKYKFVERYTDPLTGKDKRVSMTHSKKTKKVQEEMLIRLQEKIKKQSSRPNETMNFKTVCDKFLVYYKDTVRPSTYVNNKQRIERLADEFGEINFINLTPGIFNSFFNQLISEQNFKYATTLHYLTSLKQVINFAFLHLDLDKRNIKELLVVPKKNISDSNDWKFLETDELNSVLNHLKKVNIEHYNLAMIMVNCGMRFGEIISVDYIKDINFKNKSMVISKTYSQNLKQFGPTKTGKTRTIYFNNETQKILRHQINLAKLKSVKYNFPRDNHLLFLNKLGYPFALTTFNRYLKSVPGITKKVSSHIFRHTFITRAIEAGIQKELIVNQVGHRDSSMIDKVYSHYTKEMVEKQKEAMKKFKIAP